MKVAIVGTGPAPESVAATLEDVDVDVVRTGIDGIASADLAVVSGLAGSEGFERANDQALASETPWIAVEVGGIGATPVEGLDAAVTTFQPGHVCFDCLATRVQAGGVTPADEATGDRAAVRLAGSYAGLLAVRALAGQEVFGVVIEVPHAERTLLPVPGCTCDTGTDRELDISVRDRTVEESIAHAELAVDQRLGPIQSVGEHDSFPAPYYLSMLADTGSFSDASAPDRAAGVAVDWDTAFMKALGESLERYSAAIYRESEFETAPVAEMDGPSPDEFVRPETLPVPDPEEPIEWTPGRDLLADEPVSLPAGMVFFPSPDSRFAPAITTGLGLGNGGVGAVLSGLYEVIERDATMLAWYSTFEPLSLSVADETFQTLSRRAAGEGLSVTPLLVTQDVDVPVVSVAVHRDEWPRFAIGSAADLDPNAAAVDALSEAIQNWMELRGMGQDAAEDAEGAIGKYATLPPAAEALLDTEGSVPAADVGPENPPSGQDELDAVLERTAAAGQDVYAASVTPRDVSHVGFEAVRVLVPQAQPLFVAEAYFGERARTVPASLGFESRLDREFHPYP